MNVALETPQPTSDNQQQQPQQAPAERPSVGSALGNALGGKFGISRKKTSSDAPPPSNTSNNASANGTPGSLLEITTDLSSFSAAAVDDSQFAVPSGFKKVEPDARRVR